MGTTSSLCTNSSTVQVQHTNLMSNQAAKRTNSLSYLIILFPLFQKNRAMPKAIHYSPIKLQGSPEPNTWASWANHCPPLTSLRLGWLAWLFSHRTVLSRSAHQARCRSLPRATNSPGWKRSGDPLGSAAAARGMTACRGVQSGGDGSAHCIRKDVGA